MWKWFLAAFLILVALCGGGGFFFAATDQGREVIKQFKRTRALKNGPSPNSLRRTTLSNALTGSRVNFWRPYLTNCGPR